MSDSADQQQKNSVIGRPFPKGVSGNPKGRPRNILTITEMLRAGVEERPAIIARVFELAESDDERVALEAIKFIANKLEPPNKDGTAVAQATVVNIIRGGSNLGMEPQ